MFSGDTDQISLGDQSRAFTFFFSRSSLGNFFAHIARVTAIESANDRLFERTMVRVIQHHGCPYDRLQRHPMSADRSAECESNDAAAKTFEHCRNLTLNPLNNNHRSFRSAVRSFLTRAFYLPAPILHLIYFASGLIALSSLSLSLSPHK